MANGLIVVTAATGHIGRALAETLLAQGAKVRAVGRSAERLGGLKKKGAETFVGSVDDAAAMTKAFAGAQAVFALLPPDPASADVRAGQNKVSAALTQAIAAAGVKYAVHLSSVGANHPQGMGPVSGLYDSEQRFNKLDGVNVLHLRPGYFMENHLNSIGMIKHMGVMGSAVRADVGIGMIATRDIAAAAARRLAALDFSGKSALDLMGPRDYTLAETASILGTAIGKPELKYVQFPYPDAEKGMVAAGLSPDYARLLVEMSKSLNEGLMKPTQPRSKDTTTPTTLEEFSKTFAAAFKAN